MTHFIHIALSTHWTEEIRIHHAVVPMVFISLLFCWAACCAGFYSNILVKMNTPYGIAQLLSTVKFNIKSEDQGN